MAFLKFKKLFSKQQQPIADQPQATPVPGPCFLCPTLSHHHAEVSKILQKAKNERPELPPDWLDTPIFVEPTPDGPIKLTLAEIQTRYKKDHPEWDKCSESFPPGPLYFDKLEKSTPYWRARDLENKIREAKKMIQPIVSLTENQNTDRITEKILESIKPMTEELSLDPKKVKQIRNAMKNEVAGKVESLADPTKWDESLKDLQESAVEKMERASPAWTNYTARIGEMGEFSAMKSVHRAIQAKPAIVVQGYRISKYLAKSLGDVGIVINEANDVEHDVVSICANGGKLSIGFVQAKVLLESKTEDSFLKKLEEKVKKSLSQTRADITGFITINPDLTSADLDMIQFMTLSCLPATMNEYMVCDSCAQYVLFREDLNNDMAISDTLADQLHSDIVQQFKSGDNTSIKTKLGIYEVEPPTEQSLKLLLQLSARLVGLGSLYPIKTYDKFYAKLKMKMNHLDTKSKRNLEQVLFLGPEQSAALTSSAFAVSGFYGTGKTTVLEVACIRVAENREAYPNPKVIFIAWDNAQELKNRFREKFEILTQNNEHLRDESFEVFDMEQARNKFTILPGVSKPTNVQLLNASMEKIKESYPDFSQLIIAVDEVPFNSNHAQNWTGMSGDWTRLILNQVNLIMALKPALDRKDTSISVAAKYVTTVVTRFVTKTVLRGNPAITLQFPPEMKTLLLKRQYRTTQTLLPFLTTIMKHCYSHINSADQVNISAISPTPGHEVLGDRPEVLLLPGCNCWASCRYPLDHLYKQHQSKLLSLLRRVNSQLKEDNITLVIQADYQHTACIAWLEQQLASEECLAGVQVKTIDQVRGVEYPALVTITDGGIGSGTISSVMDVCTRVTCRLYIVSMDRAGDGLIKGMRDAVRRGEAVTAVEQEED